MIGPNGWSAQKSLLRGFLDRVWSKGDLSEISRQVAPSYHIHHDPNDPWHGQILDRAGFCHRVTTSRAAAPDQQFDVCDMVEEADRVAVAWHWSGTHLGDLPGMPATRKRLSMSGLTIYSFQGGLLSGHWQVADRLSVFQQITTAGRELTTR